MRFPKRIPPKIRKDYQFKTSTDVEVILPLFEKFGLDGIAKLDGMFAFAIFDKQQMKLHICRDRFGIKPLYYFQRNSNEIIFSSFSVFTTFFSKLQVIAALINFLFFI